MTVSEDPHSPRRKTAVMTAHQATTPQPRIVPCLPGSPLVLKGGPEPSSFEDLCLVNVSVKYISKLCFGTIKIQPELKYLKTILEDFTS